MGWIATLPSKIFKYKNFIYYSEKVLAGELVGLNQFK